MALSLNNLASLHCDAGEYAEAWSPALRAAEILLTARAHAGTSVMTRSSFFGERASVAFLPCLARKLGKKADALALLESQQALGLRELLAEASVRARSRLPAGDARRVAASMAKINALNSAVEKAARHGQPTESLREQLRKAEREYDLLMADLREKNEQFVAIQTAQAVTTDQIVKSPVLDEQTAIVGWTEYREMAYGFVARKNGVKWAKLPGWKKGKRKQLVQRIRGFARTTARNVPATDASALEKMHQLRFKPLEPHLAGVTKLIVIAQGWAAHVPVEMLLTRQPGRDEHDLSRWPWLDQKYEISYAPSATTLDILVRQRAKRREKKWSRPLLVMADPPFSEKHLTAMNGEKVPPRGQLLAVADGAASSAVRELLRFNLKATPPRLPGTRWEARMIADELGTDKAMLLLGPKASERKLFDLSKSAKLKEFRYVHIASHGLADSDRPELSGLVLARVPPDKDYDGILHMREVFHLKLDADLVVLSACQSGLGRYLHGEGLVGLSTAFFFAGTPSLVISLWNVPDAPTALLMQRFYRNLKSGKTKSAALREAKAWLRNLTRDDLKKLGKADSAVAALTRGLGQVTTAPKGGLVEVKPFAHPHYWAGFILTGDPR